MELNDLQRIAESMARPVLRLSSIPSGQAPIACFGGPALAGSTLPGKHLLSFDARAVPPFVLESPLDGAGTLHEGDDDSDYQSTFALLSQPVDFSARPVAGEQVTTFEHLRQGSDDGARRRWVDLETHSIPLYGYAGVSLPSAGDLVQHGPSELHDWLCSLGWEPEHRYGRNLDALTTAVRDYDHWLWQEFRGVPEQPPLLDFLPSRRTFAVFGGWPRLLLDEPLPEGRLLLTVFAGEEPRRHVVHGTSGFVVVDDST